MKIILLLAILFISCAAFARDGKNKKEIVTNAHPQPTHVWIINLDKMIKHTRNISLLQPVIAVMKAMSRPQAVEIKKLKTIYL